MAVEPFLGTRPQRAFVLAVLIQAIIVLTMIVVTFSLVDQYVELRDTRYKTLPCYLALFGLAEIFEVFIALDALRLRNTMQLFGLLMFHIPLIFFASMQVRQTQTALVTLGDCDSTIDYIQCGGTGTLWMKVRPFLIVAPCVLSVSWFMMLYFVRQLYWEFGWVIFHVVGADPKMKTMYTYYQIMICLLKFDFFFFTGVTMQLLIVILQTDSAEFGVTIAAIPVVLVLLVLCGLAVQREIKIIMLFSLCLMLAASSYLYKLVRFFSPDTRDQYLNTRATLTAFTIVAFIMLIASFAVGIRCFADFDRGLQHSKTQRVPMRPGALSHPSSGNMSQNQDASGLAIGRRISIE